MTHRLLISVTEEEHRLLRRAAKLEGQRLGLKLPVATYIRRAALMAANFQDGAGVEQASRKAKL